MTLFGAPEPKAQVHYCDHALFVVCSRKLFTFSTSPLKPLNGIQWNLTGSKIWMSSTQFVFFGSIRKTRWPPWTLIGWDILDISSEIVNGFQRDLTRSKISTSSTKFVFFGMGKNKMAALAFDWHFDIFVDIFNFSSETTKWNSWKLDRKQDLKVLYQVCVFFGQSENQDGRTGLWLTETFFMSPLKPLNGIQRNLIGSKISTSSTKFVFFRPINKTRWLPWPLIGWYIFDASSETAERNSTKLDWKQDLNVLYQVCVFQTDWKNKMAVLADPSKSRHIYSGARFVSLWAPCFTI